MPHHTDTRPRTPVTRQGARAREEWVLDLRDIHDGNAVNQTGPDGTRVTNATADATADGYRVEAQRRTMRGRKGTCIRLSAPDGRTLNLIGWLGNSTTNAVEPTGDTLSRDISYVFSAGFKRGVYPERAHEAARRINTVIDVGHECLRQSITGARALILIRCAAEDLAPAIYRDWANAAPSPDYPPSPTLLRLSRYAPKEIKWLRAAGFTPETTREWFGERSVSRKSEVDAFAALRDHGWTREQVRMVQRDHSETTMWVAWAPVGPEHYDLAHRAGLAPGAAKRLLRRGEWDERALETLAALRT